MITSTVLLILFSAVLSCVECQPLNNASLSPVNLSAIAAYNPDRKDGIVVSIHPSPIYDGQIDHVLPPGAATSLGAIAQAARQMELISNATKPNLGHTVNGSEVAQPARQMELIANATKPNLGHTVNGSEVAQPARQMELIANATKPNLGHTVYGTQVAEPARQMELIANATKPILGHTINGSEVNPAKIDPVRQAILAPPRRRSIDQVADDLRSLPSDAARAWKLATRLSGSDNDERRVANHIAKGNLSLMDSLSPVDLGRVIASLDAGTKEDRELADNIRRRELIVPNKSGRTPDTDANSNVLSKGHDLNNNSETMSVQDNDLGSVSITTSNGTDVVVSNPLTNGSVAMKHISGSPPMLNGTDDNYANKHVADSTNDSDWNATTPQDNDLGSVKITTPEVADVMVSNPLANGSVAMKNISGSPPMLNGTHDNDATTSFKPVADSTNDSDRNTTTPQENDFRSVTITTPNGTVVVSNPLTNGSVAMTNISGSPPMLNGTDDNDATTSFSRLADSTNGSDWDTTTPLSASSPLSPSLPSSSTTAKSMSLPASSSSPSPSPAAITSSLSSPLASSPGLTASSLNQIPMLYDIDTRNASKKDKGSSSLEEATSSADRSPIKTDASLDMISTNNGTDVIISLNEDTDAASTNTTAKPAITVSFDNNQPIRMSNTSDNNTLSSAPKAESVSPLLNGEDMVSSSTKEEESSSPKEEESSSPKKEESSSPKKEESSSPKEEESSYPKEEESSSPKEEQSSSPEEEESSSPKEEESLSPKEEELPSSPNDSSTAEAWTDRGSDYSPFSSNGEDLSVSSAPTIDDDASVSEPSFKVAEKVNEYDSSEDGKMLLSKPTQSSSDKRDIVKSMKAPRNELPVLDGSAMNETGDGHRGPFHRSQLLMGTVEKPSLNGDADLDNATITNTSSSPNNALSTAPSKSSLPEEESLSLFSRKEESSPSLTTQEDESRSNTDEDDSPNKSPADDLMDSSSPPPNNSSLPAPSSTSSPSLRKSSALLSLPKKVSSTQPTKSNASIIPLDSSSSSPPENPSSSPPEKSSSLKHSSSFAKNFSTSYLPKNGSWSAPQEFVPQQMIAPVPLRLIPFNLTTPRPVKEVSPKQMIAPPPRLNLTTPPPVKEVASKEMIAPIPPRLISFNLTTHPPVEIMTSPGNGSSSWFDSVAESVLPQLLSSSSRPPIYADSSQERIGEVPVPSSSGPLAPLSGSSANKGSMSSLDGVRLTTQDVIDNGHIPSSNGTLSHRLDSTRKGPAQERIGQVPVPSSGSTLAPSLDYAAEVSASSSNRSMDSTSPRPTLYADDGEEDTASAPIKASKTLDSVQRRVTPPPPSRTASTSPPIKASKTLDSVPRRVTPPPPSRTSSPLDLSL